MKFEKLLPEIQELINKDEEKYPHLIKTLKGDIGQALMVTKLTVDSAQQIVQYLDTAIMDGQVEKDSDNFMLRLYQAFGE